MTKESYSITKFFKLFVSALKGQETEFTTGSINRAIVLLSIPIIAEMTGEALFALIDMIFVSRVSVNAVATIGLTEAPLMIIFSLAIGLSMAATAIVARRVGEKDFFRASNAAFQAIVLAVFLGVILGIIGYFNAAEILRLMGGDSSLIEEGVGYTEIMYGANVSIVLIFLINGVFRGAGNASIAMKSLLIANGLNILLDPIFIFGFWFIPEFGVEGAAIATTIGRSVGVVYQIFYLINGKALIKITRENLAIKWDTIKELIIVSAGGIGQFLIETLSWLFLVRIVSAFGKDVVAGYQISFRVIYFTLLPSWGMANAAAALVGQNLGASKPERAEKSVWVTAKWNGFFLIGIAVIFSLFPSQILLLLFEQPREVIATGADALRIICLGYIFFAYGMVVGQGFNGAGDTRTPMYISLVVFWLIQIPLSYFLSFNLGWESNGVFFCIAFCHSLYAVIAIALFRKGKWKKVKV